MITYVSCVLREVNGVLEYRRLEDLAGLPADVLEGERVFSGNMASTTIKTGPSDSHLVTVWDPRGPVTVSRYSSPIN